MKEVYVIGAGIIGLTTAYELSKRGYKVTIFEKERYPAQKCSYANGGQISVSNSEVWNTMANVKKGLKWIFQKDAPLYIKPTFEWNKLKWLAKFLGTTLRNEYEHNTIRTIKMGIKSQILYNILLEDEQIEFDRLNTGILHFYKDQIYFDAARHAKQLYEPYGVDWQVLNPEVLKTIEPTLTSPEIIGGVFTASDWTGDIFKFCSQLSTILRDKYKVNFVTDTEIDTLENYKEAIVVLCAGVGSQNLAKTIGEDLNIYPVKGYSITLHNCDPDLLPQVSLLDDQAKIVTSTYGTDLRVAGTAEFCGENYDITRSRIQPLLNWVEDNFPDIDCSNYSQWACLRPMTPNMLPVIQQSKKQKNIFYNTGHGHLGWTLGPATAYMVSDIIDGVYKSNANPSN